LADMFRGRIMIPLCDAQGSPIGFTARLLNDDPDAPKYINTPQTILYDKSRHVFGLHQAKESIRQANYVVIVEGNLDVIASHQADVTNVVATAGTALTTYHLKTLQRFTNDIRLCFDQDKAGIAAAERSINVAQGIGVQLSIITVPNSKDPDELIQKDPKTWAKVINEPQYAVDWLIERYKNIYNISTASGKKAFSDVLLQTISKLQDKVEQDHYLLELAKLTGVGESAMRSKLGTLGSNPSIYKKPKNPEIIHTTDNNMYEDQLLCLLVTYPITRRLLETDSQKLVFSNPERQRVFEYIEINPADSFGEEIPEDLQDIVDYVKILLFKAEELYNSFDSNERLRELSDLIFKLTSKNTTEQKQILTKEIRKAEEAGDERKVNELLGEFNNLLKKD
jgi:DNA primase